MTAQAIQTLSSSENRSNDVLAVSFRLIMALYSIIPICLGLQVIDEFFWSGYLRTALPSSPQHFLVFQILFGTPHILASTIILAGNKEYLHFYQSKILIMSIAIAMFFALGSVYLSPRLLYICVAAWTVFHVLKQQHGIARGICRLPSWAFYLSLVISVGAGLLIYLGIFLRNSLEPQSIEWLRHASASTCALLLLTALFVQRYVAAGMGKLFYWSNILLVLSSFYLYLREYYFLAILVPRLVHDITAYIVYVTHDYNRHHRQAQNGLYRLAQKWHISIFIVLPLLSFGLAFALQNYGDACIGWLTQTLFGVEIRKTVTVGVLGYFALMHYYTEGFIWKAGSPCRRYLAFSK